MITPDITPDHGAAWIAAADAHDLDKVFLVAPSSTDERIAMTAAASRGFVYAAAVMGVTGARDASSDLAGPLVRRVRASGDIPVAVGIGVSNGDQAAEVAAYADGVIVGSAFVRTLLDHPGDEAAGLEALRALTADLAEGVRRGCEVGPHWRSRCSCSRPPAAAGPQPMELTGTVLDPPFEVSSTPLVDTDGRGLQPHRGHRQGPHAGLLRLHQLPRHLRAGDGDAGRHAHPARRRAEGRSSTWSS